MHVTRHQTLAKADEDLSTKGSPECHSFFLILNAKIPSSSDKNAATVASSLISLAAAWLAVASSSFRIEEENRISTLLLFRTYTR